MVDFYLAGNAVVNLFLARLLSAKRADSEKPADCYFNDDLGTRLHPSSPSKAYSAGQIASQRLQTARRGTELDMQKIFANNPTHQRRETEAGLKPEAPSRAGDGKI